MASNATEGAKRPKKQKTSDRGGAAPQYKQVVRKVPQRVTGENNRHNIYINTKTDFKAQLKRCEELLNSGAKEIYLHCLGFAITRGLNLALQLINNSSGHLDYAINTSTIHLLDELHPLRDDDDISLRQRNNSALHIKIYTKNSINIEEAASASTSTPTSTSRSTSGTQQKQQRQQQQPRKHYKQRHQQQKAPHTQKQQ